MQDQRNWTKNRLRSTPSKLTKQRKRAKSKQSETIRPRWRRKYRLKKRRFCSRRKGLMQ